MISKKEQLLLSKSPLITLSTHKTYLMSGLINSITYFYANESMIMA